MSSDVPAIRDAKLPAKGMDNAAVQLLLQQLDQLKPDLLPMPAHCISRLDEHTKNIYITMLAAMAMADKSVTDNEARLLHLLQKSLGMDPAATRIFEQAHQWESSDLKDFFRAIREAELDKTFMLDAIILLRLDGPINDAATALLGEMAELMEMEESDIRGLTGLACKILGLPGKTDMPFAWNPYFFGHWHPFLYKRKKIEASLVHTFTGHSDSVNSVAFSPDGKNILSGSADQRLMLWDLVSNANTKTFTGHSGQIYSVTFSPDGKSILSGSWDDTIKLWDLASGKAIKSIAIGSDVNDAAFSPDGKSILSGSDNSLKLWDSASGKNVSNFSGHSGYIFSVTFSPDGKNILSGSQDNSIKLWDTASGKEIKSFTGHGGYVQTVTFSPDGKRVLSSSNDGSIRLWDIDSGNELGNIISNGSKIAFNGILILSFTDKILKVWDIQSKKLLHSFESDNPVNSVSLSPLGDYALSGHHNGEVKLWKL
ncbi:PD40 domain-containing protein [Desulfobotulus mexicanus]|nr:PD40 domain-containing protein [Desulfobotulus mexicanus]